MAQRKVTRTFDAMPDTLDFRDVMYVPTLMEVAPVSDIGGFRSLRFQCLTKDLRERARASASQPSQTTCSAEGASDLWPTRSVRGCSTQWRSATMNGPEKITAVRVRVGRSRVGINTACALCACGRIPRKRRYQRRDRS